MADKNAKSGWTDREILVCLLNVMEYSNCKLEYGDVPYPPGRNANGFRQKINNLKRELKGEFESIKAGNPVDSTPKKKTADATPKSTPRKRKAAAEEDGEETPKKRGRPKKWAAKSKEPVEAEAETVVKDELDNHLGAGFEAEIVEQV
ncbi:hypothetical protein HBI29_071680 [Parastagonospora nodorum]|nr:hypothetical protein HBH75_019390 [Parastagonospora nodorum]KAH5323322.1 hypothetical protein HBI11_041760 [Parastagonospora nodorum]KAH5519413.1 hypothetical protein HBI29_071680 [Parastagonospora nodorum]